MQLRSGKNKNNIRRRLFYGFQQSIKCTGRQHMNFIDNINLISTGVWRKKDFIFYLTDIINTGVGGTVYFDYVQGSTSCYFLTICAVTTRSRRRSLQTI